MLKLSGVSKSYLYGANLFGNLEMQIDNNEIVSVLGECGSGKTTLLKMISACTEFDGSIQLNGLDIKSKTDDIIMVFDDLALFDNKSFYYNLAYPLLIRKYTKEEIDKRVNFAAEKFGIVACLKDKVKNAKLIDKKRLAIARILLRDAKLIVIDEITSGLNKPEANMLWNEVMPVLVDKAKLGSMIVYSTIDRYEAMSISDRIAVVHYGDLKQFDTFENIVNKPNNIWAIEKLVNDYYFEKAYLSYDNDNLNLVFENKYQKSIDFIKDKIPVAYYNKFVYVGCKNNEFCVTSDRQEKVKYSIRGKHGYYLRTETDKVVYCKEKMNTIGTLPIVEKVSLFDYENENNILM